MNIYDKMLYNLVEQKKKMDILFKCSEVEEDEDDDEKDDTEDEN